MDMKNLFSVNKTLSADHTDFDGNPYLVRRVSGEVKYKLDNAFTVLEEEMAPPPPTEEYTALKKKEGMYWIVCLICLVAGIAVFFLGTEMKWFDPASLLFIPVGILLAAALVLCILAQRVKRKREAMDHSRREVNFDEATKRLEAAAAEAAAELGVPDTYLSVDIFPYHYTVKEAGEQRYGKKGRYDNLTVSFFLCDDGLHAATAKELFVIPTEAIAGYRMYDEPYEIDMWLKSEASDSDAYASFDLRRSGFFGRKGRGYCGIVIRGEETYEILVPNYDFEQIRALLRLQRLAD